MKQFPTVLVPWTRQAEITVAIIEATNMITPKIKIPEIEVLHFKTLFEERNAQLGGCHVLTILNLRRWPACRCRSSTRARSGPASAPPHPPTPGNSLLLILSSNSNNIYQEQHNQHQHDPQFKAVSGSQLANYHDFKGKGTVLKESRGQNCGMHDFN